MTDLIGEAQEYIKWSSLNFGLVRLDKWEDFQGALTRQLDRQPDLKVQLMVLHPAMRLPEHLEIAFQKTASGIGSLEDVRLRALGAVKLLRKFQKKMDKAFLDRLEIKCTRYVPSRSILATEKRIKIEFYPCDHAKAVASRPNLLLGPPTVDPRKNFWVEDFDGLWNSDFGLRERQWLQKFRMSECNEITVSIDHESLGEAALHEIERLLTKRQKRMRSKI